MLHGVALDMVSSSDAAEPATPTPTRPRTVERSRLGLLPSVTALVLLFTCALLLLAGISAADQSPHTPIAIDGDAGFTSANGVVSGSGTDADPYIIEEWSISGSSADGVRIQNTNAHFVLRRIIVHGPGTPGGYGIWMSSVRNALIDNITVVDMAYGVQLTSSRRTILDNVTVSNGTIGVDLFKCYEFLLTSVSASGFRDGITIRQCESCYLDGCKGIHCSRFGIRLEGLSTSRMADILLYGCNASGNARGISLVDTEDSEILDGIAVDNSIWDIELFSSRLIDLHRNRMGKGGLYVDDNLQVIDAPDTNTVDGKALRYLIHIGNVTLDRDTGQVILYRCTNITIANLTFDGVRQPIHMVSSKRCDITNCTIKGAYYGVRATECGLINVTGVRIEGWANSLFGILVDEVNITSSDISGGENGIKAGYASISDTSVGNCTNTGIVVNSASITNTTIWNCTDMGIYAIGNWVDWDLWYEGALILDGCQVTSASTGILLMHMSAEIRNTTLGSSGGTSKMGISARECTVIWVENCDFLHCGERGAEFIDCQDVWVRSSRFSGRSDVGIMLEWTTGSLIENAISDAATAVVIRSSPNSLVRACALSAGSSDGTAGIDIFSSRGCMVFGCEVDGFAEGIGLLSSSFTELRRCAVGDCARGVDISTSSDVLVTECDIRDCTGAAIALARCSGALVHHNNLIGSCYDDGASRYWGHQASDDTDMNQWDNGTEGNYWADFVQWYPDAKPRGKVWDTPYDIWGLNETADQYPLTLMVDIHPPVAVAGPDRTVGENTTVTLDGRASTDDLGIMSYTWDLTYLGVPLSLDGPVANHTFGPLGTYVVALTVRDAWGNVGSDTMLVFVIDMVPPVAVAGDDITVNVDKPFHLDGRGSSDDHGVAAHRWVVDPGGLNLTLYTVVASLSIGTAGDYVAVLNVTDAQGNWATDSLVVRVRDLSPPVADAGPDVVVDQHATVTLDGSGSTDNVGVVLWSWSFRYGGEDVVLGDTAAEFTFDLAGTYQVVLTVMDSAFNSAKDVMFVRVRDTEPPVAEAGADLSVPQGTTVELIGVGSRDNVGVVGFRWTLPIDGVLETHEGPVAYIKQLDVGVYVVTLNVTDAAGNWGTDMVVVTVRDVRPPSAVAGPDIEVDQHATAILDASGSEDDVGIVSFVWTLRAAGADVVLVGPIATHAFDVAGAYEVTLTVADAAGNVAGDRLVVRVLDIEPPVAVLGSGDRTVVEGDELLLDGSASRDNVGVVSFVWTVRAGEARTIHVGPVLRVPTGAPGVLRVELRVEDAAMNAATDTLTVTVLPLNITWRLGPFMDEDDRFIEGVWVCVMMNGTDYKGSTDDTGWLAVVVVRFDAAVGAYVVATKPGYEDLRFTARLDASGHPIDPVPRMRRLPEVSVAPGLLWWLLLVAVVVCLVVPIALRRTRRSRGRPGP